VKSQNNIISEILQNYNLCEYCTGRIISKIVGKPSSKFLGKKYLKNFYQPSSEKCYICKNIFDSLDPMLINTLEKLSSYDFKTFHLGIILKPSFLERDDYIKSKFKIKGIENLKFSIAKELAKKISRKTNTNRIADDSELFIEANFKNESCRLRAKPLYIYGRYNKKIRNLAQKQESCHRCNGIGCHNCKFKGIKDIQSIEETISNFFIEKFDCNQVKINWIGGEDQFSLVMGNGRPFFINLLNPKKRNKILPKTFDLKVISLSELKKLTVQPKGSAPFKSEVSITVETEKPISLTQLKKLKILENCILETSSRNQKKSQKCIYKIEYKKIGKTQFILDLFMDGGISIKSFVQNSDTTPNVSDLIENRSKIIQLDFKNILV